MPCCDLDEKKWELVGIGTNGTLLDGEEDHAYYPVRDGQVIGLAQGGPAMRFHAGLPTTREGEKTVHQDLSALKIEIDETKKQRQVSMRSPSRITFSN